MGLYLRVERFGRNLDRSHCRGVAQVDGCCHVERRQQADGSRPHRQHLDFRRLRHHMGGSRWSGTGRSKLGSCGPVGRRRDAGRPHQRRQPLAFDGLRRHMDHCRRIWRLCAGYVRRWLQGVGQWQQQAHFGIQRHNAILQRGGATRMVARNLHVRKWPEAANSLCAVQRLALGRLWHHVVRANGVGSSFSLC